jgi:polysaccharide biosynthesis protein PelF
MTDVCLILEGTYPYVTGGVSSCVHQLLCKTPHLKYSLLFLGATPSDKMVYKYKVPSNVKLIKEVYLFDYEAPERFDEVNVKVNIAKILKFHNLIQTQNVELFAEVYKDLFDPEYQTCDPFDFLQSKQAWNFIEQMYRRRFQGEDAPSFIDYFYTWRFSHYPIFKVLSADIPRATIYHSLSTGYAGMVGAVASIRYKRPFVLTEHGIYAHEREIEINQSNWVYDDDTDMTAKRTMSYFKLWWINIFKFMAKIAYEHADVITTLYSGNKTKQIRYGAEATKISLIPNGINYHGFAALPRNIGERQFNIALVGRVVPIKDVKTFIKSLVDVKREIPYAKVFIIGPTEEDEGYFLDCERLVDMLDLKDMITFTGKVMVKDYYPMVDLLILSSISEGQPMVLLEAFSCGIPAVCTDVGACSEMLFGMSEKDKAMGACGEIVPFGRPDLLGQAIIKIGKDPELQASYADVAKKRVRNFYLEDMTINRYLNVYSQFLSSRW